LNPRIGISRSNTPSTSLRGGRRELEHPFLDLPPQQVLHLHRVALHLGIQRPGGEEIVLLVQSKAAREGHVGHSLNVGLVGLHEVIEGDQVLAALQENEVVAKAKGDGVGVHVG
jgi:hypothetical protein